MRKKIGVIVCLIMYCILIINGILIFDFKVWNLGLG